MGAALMISFKTSVSRESLPVAADALVRRFVPMYCNGSAFRPDALRKYNVLDTNVGSGLFDRLGGWDLGVPAN